MDEENPIKKFIVPIALSSIGCMPLIIGVFVIFIGVLFVLGIIEGGSGGSGSGIVYESECNYEETMVTVMDGNNTEVLATISLEDYLLGVVCVEIGACDGAVSSKEEHYIKIKFITARTYALSRSNYNSSDKTIKIRASTRDQQWCDLDTGCIITKTDDLIEGYSDEYYYNSYPGDYDQSKVDGTINLTRSYTEEDITLLRQYYKETYGELYLSKNYDSTIKTLSSSDATEYKSDTQEYWEKEAINGKTYEEILDETGSSGVTDSEDYVNKSLYKLGNYCKSTKVSNNNGSLVDLGEYPEVMTETETLNEPITQALSKNDIDELNNYIESNVDKAGYGTGAGVAAAAQSLIYGLYQHNYHLPYLYGGGHSTLAIGVDETWGANGYSYDCSAFVSWAIKNACNPNFIVDYTGGFISNYGKKIDFLDAKPGDLMVYHILNSNGTYEGHVRVVVKNTGNSLIAAESTGKNGGGMQFLEYSTIEQYSIIDMSTYYQNNCQTSR